MQGVFIRNDYGAYVRAEEKEIDPICEELKKHYRFSNEPEGDLSKESRRCFNQANQTVGKESCDGGDGAVAPEPRFLG